MLVFMSSTVKNPGHSRLNDALPMLQLCDPNSALSPVASKYDFYSLACFTVGARTSSPLKLNGDLPNQISIYKLSVRSFICPSSPINKYVNRLIYDAHPPSLQNIYLQYEDIALPKDVLELNRVRTISMLFSVRSDKKRKSFADPSSRFGWIIGRLYDEIKPYIKYPDFRIKIYIDIYSLPCANSILLGPKAMRKR